MEDELDVILAQIDCEQLLSLECTTFDLGLLNGDSTSSSSHALKLPRTCPEPYPLSNQLTSLLLQPPLAFIP